MSNAARKKALETYRARLTRRDFKRFDVMALESDRDLIGADIELTPPREEGRKVAL